MNVQVELCGLDQKFIINNLYPLYLHDLSEIWNRLPNKFGVFDEDDLRTLEEQKAVFDIWWEKPSILFPYLISVNSIPAGFGLVARPPYTPDQADFYLNEFFIVRSFRGKGVGEQAAQQLFNRYHGQWQLHTNPTARNTHSTAFWRKTLAHYSEGPFTEENKETQHDGFVKVFRFNNKI